MLQQYNTVYSKGTSELIEKKSRFIADVFPISTEEDALNFITQVKKQHWNASHHCFAYVLGEQFQIRRFSDDKEPGGTAGKPILDVLLGEEVHNALIIVTRYFGGTLLGTGGLIRAYGKSAKEGLLASTLITKTYGSKWKIKTDYHELGKIQYLLSQQNLFILQSDYSEIVHIEILIPQDISETIRNELIEKTSGKIELEFSKSCYFAQLGKELLLFDAE